MKLPASNHLTEGYSPEVASQIRKTHVGMASWAATGPFGRECEACAQYGYWRQLRNAVGNIADTKFRTGCCKKFYELTGEHGPKIPPHTESCRHFTPREE